MSRININAPLFAIFVSLIITTLLSNPCRANEDINTNPNARVIFLFITKPDDEKAEKGIEAWYQFFQNNLQTFTRYAIPNTQTGNMFDVYIQHTLVESTVSEAFLAASWHSARTLEAIGAVGAQEDKITIIDNQVYIGDLKGTLPNALLHITQEINPLHFTMSRDAIAIILLYTYAMDISKSLADKQSEHAVCKPLEMARLYATDLHGRIAEELRELTEAVQTNLDAWHCRGHK